VKCQNKCCAIIVIVAVTIAALAMRLPKLSQRPMHGDEAVHAAKFKDLLEKNLYRYDPIEYHGPTLNYFTLIPAWLTSAENLTQVTEFTLRIVPVVFGVLLVLLLLLLIDALTPPIAVIAAFLTAISPAMVFLSRYYVQEMLLVCFTFAIIVFAYRYCKTKKIYWALLAGGAVGLTHATKETCLVTFGAMALALGLTLLVNRRQGGDPLKKIHLWHILAAGAVAVAVSALFYSSFFTNPHGIIDSVTTYKTYFIRAAQNRLHIHPWYYYFEVLYETGFNPAMFLNESVIVILAIIGFIAALTKKGVKDTNRNLLRFIAFYTIITTVIYCAIPYKTPWSMLCFFHGIILLAAVGIVVIVRLWTSSYYRIIMVTIFAAVAVTVTCQSILTTYKYYDSPANPYVYAHPTTDVFTIVQKVEEIAAAHPDGRNMYIQVICPDDDYWPLPWYLRSFTNIGWWNHVDFNAPSAPVIIASPSVEPALLKYLYELPPPGQKNLYVSFLEPNTQLRPAIELHGYVKKELWDSYLQKKEPVSVTPSTQNEQKP